jgi:hypothetical protein
MPGLPTVDDGSTYRATSVNIVFLSLLMTGWPNSELSYLPPLPFLEPHSLRNEIRLNTAAVKKQPQHLLPPFAIPSLLGVSSTLAGMRQVAPDLFLLPKANV